MQAYEMNLLKKQSKRILLMREFAEMMSKTPSTLSALQDIKIKQLKEENALLEEETLKLQEYLHDISHSNELTNKENQRMRELMKQPDKNSKGDDNQKEKIDEKIKIRRLEEDNKELMKQRNNLYQTSSDLRVEIDDLNGQIRTLKRNVSSLENQLELYNSGDNDIALKSKKTMDELQAEIHKWISKHNEEVSSKQQVTVELTEKRERVLELHEENQKLDGQLQELKKMNEMLSEKSKSYGTTIETLRDQINQNQKRMKDVIIKEGQMEAIEQRHKEIVNGLSQQLDEEQRTSGERFNQMIENLKEKFSQSKLTQEEIRSEQNVKLTQMKIKIQRLEMDNQALRDAQEKMASVASSQEEKDQMILSLNKSISELNIQIEVLERKIRDLELKKLFKINGPGGKDESYRKLEEELMRTKSSLDNISLENKRLSETLNRKERSLMHLEEDNKQTMKRNNDIYNQGANDYMRELQKKDDEIIRQKTLFSDFKAEIERKLKQHEELEDKLMSHSKQTIRNYEHKLKELEAENDDLKHKYHILERMVV